MTLRRLWPLGLLVLALASSGCDSGRQNPPDTLVRVLNAAPNYPVLTFKRGPLIENPPLQFDFLGGGQRTWDTDTYNFHVTYGDLQTQTNVEVETFTKQLATGTVYTFVLYQKGGSVTHSVLESPLVTTTATDVQIQAFHAVEGAPTVDLYIVAAGTGVSGATPWGTLAFEGALPARSIATGDYDVIATEPGNPAHVLYTSPSFSLSAGAAVTFALTPDAGEGIQPFSVTVLNDTSTVLVDQSLQAGVRVINGANDRQPRDVAFNNQFTPPLFSGAVFNAATPYLPIAAGTDVPVNVTPAGNPGVLEITSSFSPQPGAKYTVFFTELAGTLFANLPQDDRRRVKSQAKLTFYDAAGSCAVCDLLVLPPGTDPDTIIALDPFYLTDPHPQLTPLSVIPVTQWAGDFDVVLRPQGTKTVVAGPTRITLRDGGLHGIILTDNPNGTTIDMTFIDDFQ
jgi:Domain of unknown function (DUF4397)